MSDDTDALRQLFAQNPDMLASLSAIADPDEVVRRAAEFAEREGLAADPETIRAALGLLTDEDLEKVAAAGEFPWNFAQSSVKW